MRMLRIFESLDRYLENVAKEHRFELGTFFIQSNSVLFSIDDSHRVFFDNGIRTIKEFSYASEKMKLEVSRYLPSIVKSFEEDGRIILILRKTNDLVLLRDLLNYFEGVMDPKHVAWILSSLYNLVCYFHYSRFSHNDISLDTYFVSPEFHSGVLLGGWWYATGFSKKMLGVPGRTYNLLSPDILLNKGGDPRIDLDLIRAIGRELLGDPTGIKVVAPDAMKDWLRCETTGDAIRDYSVWRNEVIPNSFGGRFFTKMNVELNKI